MGDFFDGKALVDMIFHVVDDPATERRFCVAGIIQTGRYRVSGKCITTDNVDQKLLQIKDQKLLRTKGNIRTFPGKGCPEEKKNSDELLQ